MAEAFRFTAGADFDEGLGHAVKAQGMELVESRVFEQDRLTRSGSQFPSKRLCRSFPTIRCCDVEMANLPRYSLIIFLRRKAMVR
jgi:hypothetical protein